MNVLEIKGSLHDIISKVDDKNLLLKMFEAFQDIIRFQETDMDLTPAQQKELEAAIKESYDEANLIDHEDAMKIHARWLRR